MPLKAAIPAIAAGISAAGGIASAALSKQKPVDQYSPTQFNANQSPQISGGSGAQISPLQKPQMFGQQDAAKSLLSQSGGY